MHGHKYKAFLIFGPPGSGKGTVGSKLAVTTGFKHISTGEVFRGFPRTSTSGKIFYEYAGKGILVPDEVSVKICSRYLRGLVDTNKLDPEKDILLLDGIPRTAAQAHLIDSFVEVLHVLVLDIPNDQIIVDRIQHRAKIEGRKDDMDEAVIRTRIVEYKTKTAAVLDCYPSDKISHIPAEAGPDEVFYNTLGQVIRVRPNH